MRERARPHAHVNNKGARRQAAREREGKRLLGSKAFSFFKEPKLVRSFVGE